MESSSDPGGDEAAAEGLFDPLVMTCPRCGRTDQVDVQATVWVRVTPDGTDADASHDGSHEYGEDACARCCACNYLGTVGEFEPEGARG